MLKITQLKKPYFEFKIDVKIAFSNGNQFKNIEFPIKSQQYNEIKIPTSNENGKLNGIKWLSIDPDLKILREIKSIDFPLSMILNQITNGNTIIERRQALDAIDYKKVSEQNLEDKLIGILKDRIINDKYFGVSTKATAKLGQIKSDKALDALLECLESKAIKNRPNGEGHAIMRGIVNSISGYIQGLDKKKKEDIFNILEHIARNGDKSYYTEGQALTSLGEYINERSFQILSEAVEKQNTYKDIIPAFAIAGLSKYSNALEKIKSNEMNEEDKLHLKILFKKAIDILIKKTQKWNSNNVRTSAVGGLKSFLLTDDNEIRKDIFKALIDSLDDSWLDVRKGALAILEATFSPDDQIFEQQIIDQLVNKVQKMAETDLRHDVRRAAELCLLSIRGKHVTKMRTILKTKKELSKYVSKKVEIRTKKVFGASLALKHSA